MSPPPEQKNYDIVWFDDFRGNAGTAPSTDKWEIVERGPNHGNQEVQDYVASTSTASVDGN